MLLRLTEIVKSKACVKLATRLIESRIHTVVGLLNLLYVEPIAKIAVHILKRVLGLGWPLYSHRLHHQSSMNLGEDQYCLCLLQLLCGVYIQSDKIYLKRLGLK